FRQIAIVRFVKKITEAHISDNAPPPSSEDTSETGKTAALNKTVWRYRNTLPKPAKPAPADRV
ncbi:hypothetical protein, partial [Paenibacillus cisolokensis]|uniref:hypothetical protein n=1 Tax=Paenibacillus cisolokensis TaxID=1658519 RepID=UPI001BD075E3